ncbi:hypothetical protein CDV31_015886 [Fusarium ambrosium]|uniref:Uncharacterized protein n=1 Tax=Fusarium ambrosium TaxID=131363 RepID=A0A428SI33_9HYPO|nr:hypothetical protein CDV31_015886 [Fusarium ambrosium]
MLSLDQMSDKPARPEEVDADIYSPPCPRGTTKSNQFAVPDETDTESLAGTNRLGDDEEDRDITPRATPRPRMASVRSMNQGEGGEVDQHTFVNQSQRPRTSETAIKQMQSHVFNPQNRSATPPRQILGWPELRCGGEDLYEEWLAFDDNRDSGDVQGWRTLVAVEHEGLSTPSYVVTSSMPKPAVRFPSSPLTGQRQGTDQYASGSSMREGYEIFSPRPPTSIFSSLGLSRHDVEDSNAEAGQLLGQSLVAGLEDAHDSYQRTMMHQLVDMSSMRIWWSVQPGGSQREAMQDLLVERQGIELEFSPESSVLHLLVSRYLPPSV